MFTANLHTLFSGTYPSMPSLEQKNATSGTVEPSFATTSRKRPQIQNTKIFPVKALAVKTSRKRTPPVSERDHFLGLTVNNFPSF